MFRNLNPGALGFRTSFTETVELALQANFQGLDLNPSEMMGILETKSADGIKGFIKERGLRWGGWGLPVVVGGDEDKFRKGIETLPRSAETACGLGCPRVFTWIMPFSDNLDFKTNFALHVERLGSIAGILDDHQ